MKQITLSPLGLFLFVFSFTLQAETPATWKLGTGLSVLDYKQTGFASTTQTWMHLKGEGSYALSESWSMDGKVGLGLLPLSKTGTSFNLRHLEMSLATSYNAFRVFDEGVFPSLGYQYQTLLNGDNYGFRNIHGPYAGLEFRIRTREKELLSIGSGYGLFQTDSSMSTTNNEFTFRASYTWKEWSEKIPTFKLQGEVKRYSLKFLSGEVGAYFYSFSALANF